LNSDKTPKTLVKLVDSVLRLSENKNIPTSGFIISRNWITSLDDAKTISNAIAKPIIPN
jgi:hypothetical protein